MSSEDESLQKRNPNSRLELDEVDRNAGTAPHGAGSSDSKRPPVSPTCGIGILIVPHTHSNQGWTMPPKKKRIKKGAIANPGC